MAYTACVITVSDKGARGERVDTAGPALVQLLKAEGYEVVENDDEETKDDYPYKVVEKSLTPTAIDAVNAEKSGKALKTLENGRVVIIRGEKKYDLTGREL